MGGQVVEGRRDWALATIADFMRFGIQNSSEEIGRAAN